MPNDTVKQLRPDMAYVITTKPERAKHYIEEYKKIGFSAPLTIFKAIDGKHPSVEFDYAPYAGWCLPKSKNTWYNRPLLPGEIGCSLSHLSVAKDALAKGYRRILVLEEDFDHRRDFAQSPFDADEPWDLIYLGRNRVRDDVRKVSDNLVQPGYSYNSHAYLLNRAGIEKIANGELQQAIIPYDEYLSAIHQQHPRQDLAFIKPTLKALAFDPQVVGQRRSHVSTITGGNSATAAPPAQNYTLNETWQRENLSSAIRDHQASLVIDRPSREIFRFPLLSAQGIRQFEQLYQSLQHKDSKARDFIEELRVSFLHEIAISRWALKGKSWNKETEGTARPHLTGYHEGYFAPKVMGCEYVIAIDLDTSPTGELWFKRQHLALPPVAGHCTLFPALTHAVGVRPAKDQNVRRIFIEVARPKAFMAA
ncbi:MAG: glycosyltransferase family 25 protein [Gammaproteobacteria bacterium]|nr:glycosyltransferase family 25 protein [Gammaproteobacteria bacterium]